MDIKDYRKQIDSIDDTMVRTFIDRMEVAEKIADYKKENNLPVYDPVREKAKLADVYAQAGEKYGRYAVALYSLLFDLSRSYQNQRIRQETPQIREIRDALEHTPKLFPDKASVACQGMPGGDSGIACDKIMKNADIMYSEGFSGAFDAVEKGLCGYGILPVENQIICGLLGEKLGHSYSPMIHRLLNQYGDTDYTYQLMEQAPEMLEVFLKNGMWNGLNVTIPYKKAVIPYCDELSPIARRLGSVNTLVKSADGIILGDNTDYYGFCSMVKESGIAIEGSKVLVLGSGGASNTVTAALQDMGADRVVVISRKGENHYGNLYLHWDADIIVNTTPVGMYPRVEGSPVDLELFPNLRGVLDVIYNPFRTRLLMQAEERGIPFRNGLHMLVAQAEASRAIFLNAFALNKRKGGVSDMGSDFACTIMHHADIEESCRPMYQKEMEESNEPMYQEDIEESSGSMYLKDVEESCRPMYQIDIEKICKVRDLIQRDRENIVLIGMPGCGKSTLGRILGEKLSRKVLDTDSMIEEKAGTSIPEIFTKRGEAAFREMESMVLEEVGKESGMVVSTGGGCVTRPENYFHLHGNSIIVWVQRELEELSISGRPVSMNRKLKDIYEERSPLYERFADEILENKGDPEKVAQDLISGLKKWQKN